MNKPTGTDPPKYFSLNPDDYSVTMFYVPPPGFRSVTAEDVRQYCQLGEVFVLGDRPYFPVAVEFHHADFDHYFISINRDEIAALDSGVHPGWTRTGEQFSVYITDVSWPSGETPLASTCRYYGLPSAGLNSHFFTAFDEECAAVAAKWPDQWLLETSNAFRAHLPDPATGACPIDTRPLYRLYNNRPDANHRYTKSLAIRQQMIDRGWVPEGYGGLGVAMCVRPDA